MGLKKDLTGLVFGSLKVISQNGFNKYNYCLWSCLCECGKLVERTIVALNKKHPSCGCHIYENGKNGMKTHGHTGSSEYKIFRTMISRCENPNSEKFYMYGAKGISVCTEWRADFSVFLKDMGERPSKHHSIDRISSVGNYEPANCRWATPTVQSRNRKSVKMNMLMAREIRASNLPQRELAKTYGVTQATINYIKTNRQWKEDTV